MSSTELDKSRATSSASTVGAPTDTASPAIAINGSPSPGIDAGGTTPERKPMIEVRHLHRFFGKLKAVNNVSFTAYPGQVVGFIGPNGSGKTTTMRILATLDLPTAGDAFVNGYSVIDDPDKVRHAVGFMPDAFGRYPNMDVVEYLDFFARAYGLRGQKRLDALERVLIFTELRKMAHKPINTLSKGMSQRLGLGRVLIHDPPVLILDEPAAGLDPRARVELRELIAVLSTELGKTILISSHILTELGEICDSAVIIEAGQVLASGTIKDINDKHLKDLADSKNILFITRVLNGQAEALATWLLEQPFVLDANVASELVRFRFEGDVHAQHDLLKRMINSKFEIIEFQRKAETLEDAFMAITKGIVQ
jgi:ABC-2 type transport system ATP-binding protein